MPNQKPPRYKLHLLDINDDPVLNIQIPSVTEVLDVISKPYLLGWYAKYGVQAAAMRDASATLGTKLHKDLETLCQGGQVEKNERTTPIIEFVEQHLSSSVLATCVQEQKLISLRYRVTGTLDVAIETSTGYQIVDLKTGSRVDWTAFAQVEMYRFMWNEMVADGTLEYPYCTSTRILHTPPKGGYRLLSAEGIDHNAFLACLEVYRQMPRAYWRPKVEDKGGEKS